MSLKKLNIAIAGATGFVGLDLVYLLSKHPRARIVSLCAQKNIGKPINFFDKRIKKKLPKITKIKNINWEIIDVIFLSLPDGEGQKFIKKNYKHKHVKFIDLSGDFRIREPEIYKYWYKKNHKAKDLIKNSIYSVSEFVKKDLKKFRIISNPGCYPTSIQLPLLPILKHKIIKNDRIVIDSKSGYSGAGKNYNKKFRHKNFFSSVHAYSVEKHKHMAELDQEFLKVTNKKIKYTFNPHILPTFRGILSSIYFESKGNNSAKTITKLLKKYHKNNKFVLIKKHNTQIGTGNVLNTNNCEISVCQSREKNKLVIFSAIDNLVKGASGQAIQNLNIIFGFQESLGLK